MKELAVKEWGHPNLTLRKAFRFGAGYLVVYPIGLGLLWLLTEKAGIWYIYSSIISGGLVAILRFVASAVFATRMLETKSIFLITINSRGVRKHMCLQSDRIVTRTHVL
jgi:hypothetical protein